MNETPPSKTTLYCRGLCTGELITQFHTTEGVQGALEIAKEPDKYIKVINDKNGVQVKRPLLVVVK
ncbi:hypothetical protein MQM1_075 [Aeromonas phage vB_AsaP_MQM1]|nr:hypothetical protein MQM1_075 [Aeromonas phage vB_AsaP_MQM1]